MKVPLVGILLENTAFSASFEPGDGHGVTMEEELEEEQEEEQEEEIEEEEEVQTAMGLASHVHRNSTDLIPALRRFFNEVEPRQASFFTWCEICRNQSPWSPRLEDEL